MTYERCIGQAAAGAVRAVVCRRGWGPGRPRLASAATGGRRVQPGPVRPSQPQSHLVVPSRTLNSRREDGVCRKNAKIGQSAPPSPGLRRTAPLSQSPLATRAATPVKPSQTLISPKRGAVLIVRVRPKSDSGQVRVCPSPAQYGLIRPNTALNPSERAESGQKKPMKDGREPVGGRLHVGTPLDDDAANS